MAKLNTLLLMAVIASALWLVKTAYDARRIFADIHRAEQEGLRLDGERVRLEAERQGQATSRRVDSTAREKLGMRTVTPAVTMYEGQATATLAEPKAAGKATAKPANASASGAAR